MVTNKVIKPINTFLSYGGDDLFLKNLNIDVIYFFCKWLVGQNHETNVCLRGQITITKNLLLCSLKMKQCNLCAYWITIYFDTFFAILAVFFISWPWPLNLWTHISWKRLIPWERNFQGNWYSYFSNYIHSLFNLKYGFFTVRPKKIRQNSMALKLDLDRWNWILMIYIKYKI